ncbi:LptA/OstA family protein, partial [Escherichia coli]|uniref:LptA/OstA family protein n=1 Tax=Escherichia coli TaxID=562 RepID=UPI0024531E10
MKKCVLVIKIKTTNLVIDLVLVSGRVDGMNQADVVNGDTDQRSHMDASEQDRRMQGNVVSLTGNIIVTRGSSKINDEKVVVTGPGGEQGREGIV